MKKFLKGITGVFLTFLTIVIILEVLYKNYNNNVDTLFQKIDHADDSVNFILTGNSYIGKLGITKIDSPDIPLNISFGGQDIFHQYIILKYAVNRFKGLKKIIIGVEYNLLGYDYEKANQSYLDRQYYPYTDTLYNNGLISRLLASSNFFRSNRDITFLVRFLTENKEISMLTDNEFIPVVAEKLSMDACRKRAKEHTLIKFDKDLIPANVQVLGKIYYLLKSKNIEMIVLVTPKTSCYRKYSDSANVALGKAALYSFFKDKNLIYLDLYGDEDFESDDFLDFDHLSKSGKNKLFTKLNDYLKLNK